MEERVGCRSLIIIPVINDIQFDFDYDTLLLAGVGSGTVTGKRY